MAGSRGSFEVEYEVKGAQATLDALSFASSILDAPKELFDDIGAALVISTQQRFESETAPDGNPWKKSFRELHGGGKTLTDTARLVKSITHEASNNGVAVGTNVLYAAIHQTGGTIKAKTKRGLRFQTLNGSWIGKQSVRIPQRAFLGLDQEDEKEILKISQNFLSKAFDRD